MTVILRWISVGMSLFALCVSCYSSWLSFGSNQRLVSENAKLRAKCLDYEAEIIRLRNELKIKENEV